MMAWAIKGLALIGDLYNGADVIIRGTCEVILKACNLG